jgi:hypothetical protein
MRLETPVAVAHPAAARKCFTERPARASSDTRFASAKEAYARDRSALVEVVRSRSRPGAGETVAFVRPRERRFELLYRR